VRYESGVSKHAFLGFTIHACHKGGNSQAQVQRANQISDQQLALMRQQLTMQANQLAMVNPSLQAIIQAGGMLPQQEAAMRSQALTGLGNQYKDLTGQLSQQLTARGITGGQFAGGGQIAKSFGELGSLEAGQQSELLNQIQLAKGQGLMGALQTGLGEAGMFGGQASSFGGQGIGALNAGVSAAQAADQASTGFFGSLIGSLAGLGGSAITKFCWVASELYGFNSAEMLSIRAWIISTWWMQVFAMFYSKHGQGWAALIRRNKIMRCATKRLFDIFLRLSHA